MVIYLEELEIQKKSRQMYGGYKLIARIWREKKIACNNIDKLLKPETVVNSGGSRE